MDVKATFVKMVGPRNFSDDPSQLKVYSKDCSYTSPGMPNYIVKPANSEEVSAIITFCNEKRIPVVPVSSKIHFFGATIPKEGGVILDMGRMKAHRFLLCRE